MHYVIGTQAGALYERPDPRSTELVRLQPGDELILLERELRRGQLWYLAQSSSHLVGYVQESLLVGGAAKSTGSVESLAVRGKGLEERRRSLKKKAVISGFFLLCGLAATLLSIWHPKPGGEETLYIGAIAAGAYGVINAIGDLLGLP